MNWVPLQTYAQVVHHLTTCCENVKKKLARKIITVTSGLSIYSHLLLHSA